jgi:DNA-binding XRE family transcriptional regulator
MFEVNIFNYRIKLGRRTKKERLAMGLTQAELGKKVGLSRQTIVAIESGTYTKDIKLVNIQEICSFLNIQGVMKFGNIKD